MKWSNLAITDDKFQFIVEAKDYEEALQFVKIADAEGWRHD